MLARHMLPARRSPREAGEEDHTVLRRLHTRKHLNSDPQREAKDAGCIRFFEVYWPDPSRPFPGLSQFEQLRRIALDPLHFSAFERGGPTP